MKKKNEEEKNETSILNDLKYIIVFSYLCYLLKCNTSKLIKNDHK